MTLPKMILTDHDIVTSEASGQSVQEIRDELHRRFPSPDFWSLGTLAAKYERQAAIAAAPRN